MTILMLAVAVLSITAITGTIVLAVTDGFRRVPARRP